MGNSTSLCKINFEDMQSAISGGSSIIINTLSLERQKCLIKGTLPAGDETETLNAHMSKGVQDVRIIVYGENAGDDRVAEKYKQLLSLGFSNVFVYPGGLFEWLLLQDIHGKDIFPTTSKENDFLKYRVRKVFDVRMINDR